MSKRFGRNQRRRMREEIAGAVIAREAVVAAHASTHFLLAKTRAELAEARSVIEEARHYLRDSIALPPRTKRHPRGQLEDFYYPTPSRAASVVPGPQEVLVTATMIREKEYAHLRHLLSRVDYDDLRQDIHFRFTLADGVVAYAISRKTLMTSPRDRLVNILQNEIARELAEMLVDDVRAQPSRNPATRGRW